MGTEIDSARDVMSRSSRREHGLDRLGGFGPGRDLDHGPEPLEGGPDGEAEYGVVERRRRDDTRGTELVEKPLRHLLRAPVLRHVGAQNENRCITAHLIGKRIPQRFAIARQLVRGLKRLHAPAMT